MIKKVILLLGTLIISTVCFAQKGDIIIDDFENGVTFTDQLNVLQTMKIEVADNPSTSGINNSKKALKFTRIEKSAEWDGFWAELKSGKTYKGYKYLHLQYYRENPSSICRINTKASNAADNNEFLPVDAPVKTGEWESLVFDLEAHNVTEIGVIGVQPDFVIDNVAGTVTYIDNIVLSDRKTLSDKFTEQIPSGLEVTSRGVNSISLSWMSVKGATGYEIYIDSDSAPYTTTSATEATIGNLDSFNVYSFSVQAINGEGEKSLTSEPVYTATTETKAEKDARMAWWREARFGMFIHWGPYAALAGHYTGPTLLNMDANKPYVTRNGWIDDYYSCYPEDWINADGSIKIDPATGKEYERRGYAEWIMFDVQIPRDEYKRQACAGFTASAYNPAEWVKMAKEAGMKYIIITSKHHDGISLMNNGIGYNVYNRGDNGVGSVDASRDLLKELVTEARKAGLKIGFYYSQALDWNNPGGMGWIPQNNETGFIASPEAQEKYVDEIVIPHLKSIVRDYNVDVIWWDMGGDSTPKFRYKMMKAIKELDTEKRLIFNSRLEDGLTSDFSTPEQSIPNMPPFGDGTDWETCMTLNDNWGYAAHDHRWKTKQDVIQKLIDIVSKGGNYLLNIGPEADGSFPETSINRLQEISYWMKVNKESIYGTQPSPFLEQLPWGRATRKAIDGKQYMYLHIFTQHWPADNKLSIPTMNSNPTKAWLLDGEQELTFQAVNNTIIIDLPDKPTNDVSTTVVLEMDGEVAPATIAVQKDGILTMPAAIATPHGSSIKIENNPANIGGWTDDNEYASWKVKVAQGGNYPISAVASGFGSTFYLTIDGEESAHFEFSDIDGTFNEYAEIELGNVDLKTGEYEIELHRISSGEWDPVNVREVKIGKATGASVNTTSKTTSEIKILNNPVSDILKFKTNSCGNTNISISDMAGAEVYRTELTISGNEIQNIPIASLPKGVYLLQVASEKSIYCEKIIKN